MYGSWGSYGSYSSLSSSLSSTSAMDISPVSSHGASCAYPSWPRRSSLDRDDTERPTSFLSDDDLLGDPFEDSDAHSVSGSSCSSSAEPSPPQQPTADELFQMQRDRAALQAALQRQAVQQITAEKERRRQAKKAAAAAAHGHRRSSPKKSGHKSKLSNMTPIAE